MSIENDTGSKEANAGNNAPQTLSQDELLKQIEDLKRVNKTIELRFQELERAKQPTKPVEPEVDISEDDLESILDNAISDPKGSAKKLKELLKKASSGNKVDVAKIEADLMAKVNLKNEYEKQMSKIVKDNPLLKGLTDLVEFEAKKAFEESGRTMQMKECLAEGAKRVSKRFEGLTKETKKEDDDSLPNGATTVIKGRGVHTPISNSDNHGETLASWFEKEATERAKKKYL